MSKEMVKNPDHYGGAENIYEAIKVIESWDLDFHLGNTVKYLLEKCNFIDLEFCNLK